MSELTFRRVFSDPRRVLSFILVSIPHLFLTPRLPIQFGLICALHRGNSDASSRIITTTRCLMSNAPLVRFISVVRFTANAYLRLFGLHGPRAIHMDVCPRSGGISFDGELVNFQGPSCQGYIESWVTLCSFPSDLCG